MVKRKKRVWALLLSAALVTTQFPSVAMAENKTPEDGSIASFKALDGDIEKQTVAVGTELSELKLPDTLEVKLYHVYQDTVIPDEEDTEPEEDSSVATPSEATEKEAGGNPTDYQGDDNIKNATKVTTFAKMIPVTWDSDPVYDSHWEGSYRFTADVGNYALSDGVKPPSITVTVIDSLLKTITGWTFVEDGVLNEGELALPDVNESNRMDFDQVVQLLPTQIRAELEGEETPKLLDITRWSCPEYIREEGNWPFSGDYTFTAELPEGYVCAQQPSVKVLLGGANTYTANNTLTEGGLTIAASNNGEVAYDDATGFTLKTGGDYEISGEWTGTLTAGGPANIITVPPDVTANVVLNEVTIDVSEKEQYCAFSVEEGGNVRLILKNENVLKSGKGKSGLSVPLGNILSATLTIDGEHAAKLTVSGGDGASGIGSDGPKRAGNITINSGTVEARGHGEGAGIGNSVISYLGGTITINGGIVTATGESGPGIGGGSNCYVTIRGGEVTATSTDGAGIGGGSYRGNNDQVNGGSGGNVIITGGFVRANSDNGAGIGGGKGYNGGISGDSGMTEINGDAIVLVSHIGRGDGGSGDLRKTQMRKGVVFVKNTGTVYGIPALSFDLTIPEHYKLTVPENSSLTIPYGITIVNNGTIENQGTINNYGTIMGNQPTGGGTSKDVSTTEVTFAVKKNESYGNKTAMAVVGDTVKITAAAQKRPANGLQRSAAKGEVDFYIGTIHPDHKLGTATIETDGGSSTASIEITLSGDDWNKGFAIGSNTIIADFGGSDHLFGGAGTSVLTILGRQTGFSIKDPGEKTYGDSDFTLTVTGEEGTGNVRFFVLENNHVLAVTADGSAKIIGAGSARVAAIKEADSVYHGETAILDITVKPRDISDAVITLAAGSYLYTGKEIKPDVISVTVDGIAVPASAFEVAYRDNIYIGTATVTITAKKDSNFIGMASTAFTISQSGGGSSSGGSSSSGSGSSSGGSRSSNRNESLLQGTWIQMDPGVWRFLRTDGSYVKNQWGIADGLWYYFDSEGQMLTGWQFINSQWYYLCTNETAKMRNGMKEGAMASGWYFDSFYQKWFYFDENGAMATGWREIDGTRYYFNPVSDGQQGVLTETSGKL